jgi:hypothetical protein
MTASFAEQSNVRQTAFAIVSGANEPYPSGRNPLAERRGGAACEREHATPRAGAFARTGNI